ncbi:MAG: VacB/RNase II family 3'-5' exoribonuclease [Candidatus Dadabacteria bacterium]|nr:VacB/RNase II family 3'-5' exoribonuclease [Candidatus Dadabacteria bacterium]
MKLPDSNDILKFMKNPSYRPMRVRELSKRLEVPKEDRKAFRKALKKLILAGTIVKIRGGRYRTPQGNAKKEAFELPTSRAGISRSGKILGRFVRTGKTGVILPRNPKIPPIRVQHNEVKGVRSSSLVIAELSSLPERGAPLGVIVDVLGKAGNLGAERDGLFFEHNLPKEFSQEVMRESNEISSEVLPGELKGRVDLQEILTLTIDNDRAKDFDDAVAVSLTSSGYKLWVSIADVSYYVKLGSAIDNEALQRGTSVYLPETVIPMLPERLSDWTCSLVENEKRLTKTVEMDFNREGMMLGFKIYNSVIRSRFRLTYTEVSHILEIGAKGSKRDHALIESLKIMSELYGKLKQRRLDRGGLDFDIPEPELIRDELGRTIDVVKSERNVAHGLIEEFMISANNAVAEYIFYSKAPSMYRIHEPPDFASIKELSQELKNLGYNLNIYGKLKAGDIQRVIFESKDDSQKIAINTLILRSLKRAVYSTQVEGHFGLALDHYTHFTSPIRRYPDLIVHRVVNSLINERRPPYDEESLEWMATHSSTRERFADEVEREAIKIERVYTMKHHLGREFDGFVISVLPFGIFVELREIFVEGFLPIERIRSRGRRFKLGQDVKVKVIGADLERRRVTLGLAGI